MTEVANPPHVESESPGEQSAEAALAHGLALYRAGRWDEALEWFGRAVAHDPALVPARLALADTLRDLRRIDDAEAEYRVLLSAAPTTWQALAGLGLCAGRRGHLAEAAALLAAAAADAPGERDVRLDLGNMLRELGRLDRAEAVLRPLVADAPDFWQARGGLGQTLRQRGQLTEAAEQLAAGRGLAPDVEWLALEYAETLRDLGRLDEAEPLFRALLAKNAQLWRAAAALGRILRLDGREQEAEAQFRAALALVPRDRVLRLDYADLLRDRGRTAEAEPLYRCLIEEGWAFWPVHVGYAFCLRVRGDVSGAVAELAEAYALAPTQPSVRLDYANLLRETGRQGDADPLYRGLIAEAPDLWQAQAGLGLGARRRGELAAATHHLAAALLHAPDVGWLRHEYASALRAQRRFEDAETVYRVLAEDEPTNWLVLVGLGQCARLRGDSEAAIAHVRAAVDMVPDAEETWCDLATEYREAGRLDEARATLREALARSVGGARTWLALGYLERGAGERAAALDVFRQGLAAHPDRPQFLLELASEEDALGHPAEAERWLTEAAAAEPVGAEALLRLGHMARARKRIEEAVIFYHEAAERPGAPPVVFAAIAEMLADFGRLPEALHRLDEAQSRIGTWPELAIARVALLRRVGLREEALAAARSAAAELPGSVALWRAWFEVERFSGDEAAIDRCLAVAPGESGAERARVAQARGMLAEQRWQLDAAEAAYAEAAALDPTLSELHEALARLAMLRFDVTAARAHLLAMKQLRLADQRRQGLSPHLAHTHIGNLFDEFAIDQEALAALVAAQREPPEARVGTLLALVREQPEHTPTAIALLLALRQAGRFGAAQRGDDADAIPPVIVQYWEQPHPPDDVAALMQTWEERNPGFRHIRFDHAGALAYLRAHASRATLQAYTRAREPSIRADLFRLAYLAQEGGVYVDADDRCLRPLAELLTPGADFLACQDSYGALARNVLGAAPGHPVIVRALRLASEAIDRGDDDMPWLSTGPGLLARAFAQTLAEAPHGGAGLLAQARILARPDLEACVATGCELLYKRGGWR
jgi:tetratricopeptide (TPR) repeat protein